MSIKTKREQVLSIMRNSNNEDIVHMIDEVIGFEYVYNQMYDCVHTWDEKKMDRFIKKYDD